MLGDDHREKDCKVFTEIHVCVEKREDLPLRGWREMDPKLLNDIASIESGSLTQDECVKVIQRLAGEPTVGLILRSLPDPPVSMESPGESLPFPVTRRVRLGVCEGFFRVFDFPGLTLSSHVRKGLAFIAGISHERLPLCLKEDLSFDFDLSPVQGSLRITVQDRSNTANLEIQINKPVRHHEYIEVWENGVLHVAIKADKPHIDVPIRGSTTLAIRHTSSLFGIGIRIAPVVFEEMDWLAACLFSAVEGNFTQASILLQKMTKEAKPFTDLLIKIKSHLNILRGLTKVEGFMLTPLPATRGPRTLETASLVYTGVWNGILACWPECGWLESPANVNDLNIRSGGGIKPEVIQLAMEVRKAITGQQPMIPADYKSYDRPLLEGWMALLAFTHLVSGKPNDALDVLSSFEPMPSDPFGITHIRTLAGHLVTCQIDRTSSEGIEQSTQEVWKQVFHPFLTSYPTEEVRP